MMETLVREAVKPLETIVVAISKAERELANRAYAELSYSQALAQINQKEAKQKKLDVGKVFKELGIEPFSKASVEKYKAAMLWKANFRGNILGRIYEAIDGTPGLVAFTATGIGAVVSAIVLGSLADHRANKFHTHMSWAWSLIPCSLLVLAIAISVIASRAHKVKRYGWNNVRIYNYPEMIPAFALSRALELHTAIPSAQFEIESLSYRTETIDPFLVMIVDGARYYLDVWDEPKFEARRTV